MRQYNHGKFWDPHLGIVLHHDEGKERNGFSTSIKTFSSGVANARTDTIVGLLRENVFERGQNYSVGLLVPSQDV